MANHKSARKRAQQDLRRRMRNRDIKSRMRTRIQKLRKRLNTAGAGTGTETVSATAHLQELRETERAIRKAASKGAIPQRRADRSISRLARAVRTAHDTT